MHGKKLGSKPLANRDYNGIIELTATPHKNNSTESHTKCCLLGPWKDYTDLKPLYMIPFIHKALLIDTVERDSSNSWNVTKLTARFLCLRVDWDIPASNLTSTLTPFPLFMKSKGRSSSLNKRIKNYGQGLLCYASPRQSHQTSKTTKIARNRTSNSEETITR